MSVINEEGIAKKLKSGITDNIWLICGDDTFLMDHYCRKLTDACVSEDLRFFNLHIYNDDERSLDDIFEAAENMPVMSDKTCLLIRNFPLCDLGERQLEDFKEKLKNIPETTVIIFFYNTYELYDGKNFVSKWSEAVGVIDSLGIVVNLSHREQNKMARMLVSRAKDRGTSIGEEEADYLIETVGGDMQNLLNEFNKVCAYADGKPVTKEMINAVAVKCVEANIFDISTAILSGDTDRAFAITNELLRTKTSVQLMIGTLTKTFADLYRYKCAYAADKTVDDFAAAYSYKGNYAYSFRKLSAFIRRVSLKGIRSSLDVLLENDVKAKSMSYDPAVLMSELISRLAESCRAR